MKYAFVLGIVVSIKGFLSSNELGQFKSIGLSHTKIVRSLVICSCLFAFGSIILSFIYPYYMKSFAEKRFDFKSNSMLTMLKDKKLNTVNDNIIFFDKIKDNKIKKITIIQSAKDKKSEKIIFADNTILGNNSSNELTIKMSNVDIYHLKESDVIFLKATEMEIPFDALAKSERSFSQSLEAEFFSNKYLFGICFFRNCNLYSKAEMHDRILVPLTIIFSGFIFSVILCSNNIARSIVYKRDFLVYAVFLFTLFISNLKILLIKNNIIYLIYFFFLITFSIGYYFLKKMDHA